MLDALFSVRSLSRSGRRSSSWAARTHRRPAAAATTAGRAPNKAWQVGSLYKYPSGVRTTGAGSRGGRGKRMDLQPYMDKALLFPGFVALTPGRAPDAAPTAAQRHQAVQGRQVRQGLVCVWVCLGVFLGSIFGFVWFN